MNDPESGAGGSGNSSDRNSICFTPNSLQVARALQVAWEAVPQNKPLTRRMARELNIQLPPASSVAERIRQRRNSLTDNDQELDVNEIENEDDNAEDEDQELTADELHKTSPAFQYFKIDNEKATEINNELVVINHKLEKIASIVGNLKEIDEKNPTISDLTKQYIELYKKGLEMSQNYLEEFTKEGQTPPSSLFTPILPDWDKERRSNSVISQNNGRLSRLAHLTFRPIPTPVIRPTPTRLLTTNDAPAFTRPISTNMNKQREQNDEVLSSVNGLQHAIVMSMRLQHDLTAVNSLKPYTMEAQSPIEFIERFDRAVFGSALTEVDKKRCFVNLIKISMRKWAPGLTLETHTLEDFKQAFLKEFFSRDAQLEVNAQFMASKPPGKRAQLLEYYDSWFEKLSHLNKPKRDVEEILLELSRKAPETIKMSLRASRYDSYTEFRQKVKDLTFGLDNVGGRASSPTRDYKDKSWNKNKFQKNFIGARSPQDEHNNDGAFAIQPNVTSDKKLSEAQPRSETSRRTGAVTNRGQHYRRGQRTNVRPPPQKAEERGITPTCSVDDTKPTNDKYETNNSKAQGRTLIEQQFPRQSNYRTRNLFDYTNEADPLQPIHPRTCCNPKWRNRNIEEIDTWESQDKEKQDDDTNKRRFYFKLDEVEVIGDLSAFSIAKTKGVVGKDNDVKCFLSTFSFITIQYLYTHIQKMKKVRERVFLTIGLCDQFFPPHDITNFQKYYQLILTELKKKGARDILILLPPPYFRNQSLLDYQFYEQIRSVILQSKSVTNHILNLDYLFFTFKEAKHGILGLKEGQDGAKYINIDVRSESFQIMKNSRRFFLSGEVSNMIAHEVRSFAAGLRERDGQQSLTNTSINNISTRRKDIFMHLRMDFKELEVLALIDTGASLGVMRRDFCQTLMTNCPNQIRLHRLPKPLQIKVANEATMEIDDLVMTIFYITETTQVISYFLIAPALVQKVIIGMNFLKHYKAVIDCATNELSLKLTNNKIITVKTSNFMDEVDSITIDEMNLISFVEEDAETIYTDDHELVSMIDHVQPLRNELVSRIDKAVQNKILTPEQGNKTLAIIIPLAHVYGPATGRYQWGKIELDLSITERWKVKKYGTPIIYLEPIRKEIKELLKNDLIIVGDSPWIHPIVVNQKPDGSIRICIDAYALNLLLTPLHHDTKKVENILFEPSTGPFFSSFDFAQGFLQIPLTEKTSKFLAFQFEGVTYLPKTLPFGTSVSSSVFNKVDEVELVSDKYVRTYVDDVLIQTPTFEKHLEQLELIHKNILSSGMTLSLKKSSIFTKSIKYLGHTLSDGCITKNFKKKAFFEEFEKKYLNSDKVFKFTSKKVVQKLVGFLNWFSRFLPNFAKDIEPFLDLIRSPPPFKPTEIHTKAYFSLKEKFLHDFVLHQIRLDRPFYIKILADELWATGCIFQRSDSGELHIITMISLRYPESALNKVCELKKYYALYSTLTRYKDLLSASKIIIDRDIGNIVKKYRETVEVNGVIAKWYTTIISFNIDASGQSETEFNNILGILKQFDNIHAEAGEGHVESNTEACEGLMNLVLENYEPLELATTGHEVIQKQALKFVPHLLLEELSSALENIKDQQLNDPFCKKVMESLKDCEKTDIKFKIRQETLHKVTNDEFWLLVIPKHMGPDVIRYLHQVYCHPGVLKTILIFKRQFYLKGVDALVTTIVGECIDCKHNKISSRHCEPTFQSTIVGEVGTLFVDHFGPFPIKKGGVQAVFVAMDRLSGYVRYEPVRALSADATIRAMDRVIEHFDELQVKVHTVISDNAPCFRSVKWGDFLRKKSVRVKFVSPYNAGANAVERQMRELGTGLRLRLNVGGQEADSHRHWDSEIKFLQDSSNSIPKKHGYSPNQILGIPDKSRDPLQTYPIHCPDPLQIAKEKVNSITTFWDHIDHSNIKICKNNLHFNFDKNGYIVIYVDGASKMSHNKSQPISAYSIWFQPTHRANCAKVIEPGMTNNQAELVAMIMALRKAREHQLQKVKIMSDSNYITSLWDEGELSHTNPKLITYENQELFGILVDLISTFEKDNLKISHIHGHTIDFGNLEADFWASHVINECQRYREILEEGVNSDIRENIMRVVVAFQKTECETTQHKQLTSGTSLAKFQIGDVVSLKNHALSQAGYGITKKFLPKYTGQFIVIGDLGPNCYKLQNSERDDQIITANIRQLLLIRRESS
ncbi:hypothetical protein V9T40_008688 [Parthenolecanium corni]|uniref:RNA-directed DNA polymerase n=1 Tax=Parthenolecanium corni TaxID=536013 RepID=A0AAN9Y846_9HEMI